MEQGLLPPPHLRGGKGHTGFPTLGGEYRPKGTAHTWGRSGKMLLSSGPSCLFSKKGKIAGSSITSDPSVRGSNGERLCWKSKQHLGFDNQTQEAFSASAHLAATMRSDAGTSMSSCRPRCLRVFRSLSEAPGSAYRISVGPATDTWGVASLPTLCMSTSLRARTFPAQLCFLWEVNGMWVAPKCPDKRRSWWKSQQGPGLG